MGKIIQLNEGEIKSQLGEMHGRSVELSNYYKYYKYITKRNLEKRSRI